MKKPTKTIKRLYPVLLLSLVSLKSIAQVGIGTTEPQASLDVRAKNHLGDVSENDGILPPTVSSLSKNGNKDGAIIFLNTDWTNTKGTPSTGDDVNFTSGIHYWSEENNEWMPISANTRGPWNKAMSNNASINNNDNIYSSGHVGIGTNDPKVGLHIQDETFRLSDGTEREGNILITDKEGNASWTDLGIRKTIFRKQSKYASDETKLPNVDPNGGPNLLLLDDTIRVNIEKDDDDKYRAILENPTTVKQKVTFSSVTYGRFEHKWFGVNEDIKPGKDILIDDNLTDWGEGDTQTIILDVIVPSGKWYEVQWMAFERGNDKFIYMSKVRKF